MGKLLLMLCTVIMLSFTGVSLAELGDEPNKVGPNTDEIYFVIITDPLTRVLSIRRGDVEIYPGLAQPSDIDDLYSDNNINVTYNQGLRMFMAFFNMEAPPLDDVAIRRALSHALDREQLVNRVFEGYMDPLNSYVPPASPYYDGDIAYYEYDLDKASQILEEAGYELDETTGLRIDPSTGSTMRQIEIMTPTYEQAPTSALIGMELAASARSIGLNITHEPIDGNVMVSRAILSDPKDFDIFMMGIGLEKNPDFLYELFHSSNIGIGLNNFAGINVPELDSVLENLFYVEDIENVQQLVTEAQSIINEYEPVLTLYSTPLIDAYRQDRVTGIVPMEGYGAISDYKNIWTTLNLEPIDEAGPVRIVLSAQVSSLNPTVARSGYDWSVLARLNDPLITEAYDDLQIDIPWVAKDWKIETWNPDVEGLREAGYGGVVHEEAHKITYYLNEGIRWSDGDEFTAEDVKFTIEFMRDKRVPRFYVEVNEIADVKAPDKYRVEVYFTTMSYWNLYKVVWLPWLKPEFWSDLEDHTAFEPWLEEHPRVEGMTKLVGIGPFRFAEYKPGEYVKLVKNEYYWNLP